MLINGSTDKATVSSVNYQFSEKDFRSMRELHCSKESIYSYNSNTNVQSESPDSISIEHGEVGDTYIWHKMTPKGNRCRPGICNSEGDVFIANITEDFDKCKTKHTRGFSNYKYDDYGTTTCGRSKGQEVYYSDDFTVVTEAPKPRSIEAALSAVNPGQFTVPERELTTRNFFNIDLLSCGQELCYKWF